MNARTVSRAAGPGLIVLVGSIGFLVAHDVAFGDALLYLAYETGFVVLPGYLTYRALADRPGAGLRQLAIGWALGYVLEVFAFMATAAIGARALFVAYPAVVVAGASVAILRRRYRGAAHDSEGALPIGFPWVIAGVCMAAVSYVAIAYFPFTPLPGTESVNYFQDYPWTLSIAADAKHNWPIQDPNVSGEPLPYHYFVNIHLAAASKVTGLDLPLVFLRLFILPLVVLLVLQIVVAGQSFARSASVGIIAACLVFFVGELQIDTGQIALLNLPFSGAFFILMYLSPSFLFGLVIFMPLVILIGERVRALDDPLRPGEWILIAILLVGASDAKVAILPLLFGALLLYGSWRLVVDRRVPGAVLLAGALTTMVSGAVYLLQYRGHSSGLEIEPFRFIERMPAVALITDGLEADLPAFPGRGALLSAGGLVLGLVGLLAAQLAGLVWLSRRQGHDLDAGRAWLLSLLGVGLAALVVLGAAGTGNQLYFVFYGVVAGCLLSAEGLRIAWLRRPKDRGRATGVVALACLSLLTIAALMAAPLDDRLFSGSEADAHAYMLRYGALFAGLAGLVVVATKLLGPSRWAAAALACAAVLTVGAFDTPLGNLRPALSNAPTAPTEGRRITPELYSALTWIRDNSPADSIVAVNNASPYEFNHAAFTERRLFLGGWGYSQRTREASYKEGPAAKTNPFADRLALNTVAFARGDSAALGSVIGGGDVRFLVVDEVNGYPVNLPALRRFARVVYEAPGVTVLERR